MKINWRRKLTSRKLWVAVAALVTGFIIAFGGKQSDAQTVSGCIMSLGSVIAYIVGEGLVDSARAGKSDSINYICRPEDQEDEEETDGGSTRGMGDDGYGD